MSVSLSELAKLIEELGGRDEAVDTAIEECEKRLKLLRHLKNSLGVKAEPKPRGSRKKETASA